MTEAGSWDSRFGYLGAFHEEELIHVGAHVDEVQLHLARVARTVPGVRPDSAARWTPNLTVAMPESEANRLFFKENWPLVEHVFVQNFHPLINEARVMEVPWQVMTFVGDRWGGARPSSCPAIQLVTTHVTDRGRSWWTNAKMLFWWMLQVESGRLTIYKVLGRVAGRYQVTDADERGQLFCIPECQVGWELTYPNVERYTQDHWSGSALILLNLFVVVTAACV